MQEEESKVLHLGTLWGRHLSYSPAAIALAVAVTFASIVPSLFGLFGSGLSVEAMPAEGGYLSRRLFWLTVFEWLSIFAAVSVSVFAWGRSRIAGNFDSHLLASVLPVAAALDVLHAWWVWSPSGRGLGAEPLLWTAGRTYLGLALVFCGAVSLYLRPRSRARRLGARSSWFLALPVLAFAFAVAGSQVGPPLVPWNPLLARPWDLPALFLFAAAGLAIFPQIHRRQPSLLSYALVLSAVPLTLSQAEMAFGAVRPGDAHFLLAHWQKLLVHLVLLGGVTLDYIEAQHGRRQFERGFKTARKNLRQRTEELEKIDRERVMQESRRRLAERSLRMLEKAVETMSLGVTIADLDGKLLYVNPAEAGTHGYRVEELLGKNARIFSSGHESGGVIPPRPITNWTRERVDVTRDGREFPVRLVSDLVSDEDGRPLARVTISEDITERKFLERLKQDFISNVSHELRTPLTSILASLRLLDSGRLDEEAERRRELVSVAHRNGQRLLQLINDLLDLQKLTSGKVSFEIRSLHVGEVLNEALENLRALAESCGVELELQVDEGLWVLADRGRLIQIVSNLLSNAIKFSPHGECVKLAAEVHNASALFSVTDHGPGIPKEFQKRLFEPFSQADTSATRSTEGSGLGLSIVKNLVEQMGGEIRFESGPEIGTTFRFELPSPPVSPSPFPLRPSST